MGLLSVLSTSFYIIVVYPIYCVTFCAYALLSLLASPFIYLGSSGLWLILLPLRILISLKALLIYLGVASLAGAGAALLLYSITTLTVDLLLNRFSNSSTVARLKSRPKYRAIEGAKYSPSNNFGISNDLRAGWGYGLDTGSWKKSGLVPETILEEESQDSEV